MLVSLVCGCWGWDLGPRVCPVGAPPLSWFFLGPAAHSVAQAGFTLPAHSAGLLLHAFPPEA